MPVANFLKLIINNVINITQGIRDSKENIIPNTPADDGIIIKNPEANPHKPTDFLNLGLFIKAYANSNTNHIASGITTQDVTV